MKTIKFDKDFKKLENENFTTIRDHDKELKLHDIVCIKSPSHEFKAEVIGMKYIKLRKIPYLDLCHDLEIFPKINSKDRFEPLLEAFREYYEHADWEDFVYFYNFKRCS